jgi:hypothetical protein
MGMNLYYRLRYLLNEGFDVVNISGYDGNPDSGKGRIFFKVIDSSGDICYASESWPISPYSLEAAMDLLLKKDMRP